MNKKESEIVKIVFLGLIFTGLETDCENLRSDKEIEL